MTLTTNQKKAGLAVTAVAVGLTVLLIATHKKKDNGGTTNDPTGNGAINTPTFNATTVALRLVDCMKVTGTDEEGIFEILTTVNQVQFGKVVAAFGKRQYNKLTGNQISYVPFYTLNYYNLREWLENELSDENYFTLRKKYPNYL